MIVPEKLPHGKNHYSKSKDHFEDIKWRLIFVVGNLSSLLLRIFDAEVVAFNDAIFSCELALGIFWGFATILTRSILGGT